MVKLISAWFIGLVIGIYAAFVATCLWNWFAVETLHVSNISFFGMVGIIWLIQIINYKPDADKYRWDMLCAAIDSCVPDDKKEMLSETLKEKAAGAWLTGVKMAYERVAGITITLILGFGLRSIMG